jgi:hypothetical protein
VDELEIEIEIDPEFDPEFDWRLDALMVAGFTYPTAFRLAMELHSGNPSWHDAARLKRLGMGEQDILDQLID